MKKFIKTVTLTGADDSIKPEELIPISKKYPFVEWGILLSKISEGTNRFPSLKWQQELYDTTIRNMNFSGHICGRWVREICKGDWSFYKKRHFYSMYERFQLNFHAQVHSLNAEAFLSGEFPPNVEFIFQLDNVNNHLLLEARKQGLICNGLFDISGGAGILPNEWQKSWEYMGYAGGLSPDNLEEQLGRISKVCGK